MVCENCLGRKEKTDKDKAEEDVHNNQKSYNFDTLISQDQQDSNNQLDNEATNQQKNKFLPPYKSDTEQLDKSSSTISRNKTPTKF